ncbi:hypothetical protein THAOC_10407 [Thalassiosira oceanica]|uniref:Uncharacterized protein n=1 Tax=Thalassiosira oceanica TaxID=159749 RepID=K0T4V8_THAOC|nr:hypothetical protein THAOC_10407 [Thalassiosira oceanica]|eukprot:EJK68416.1 hypothetical protein THAOC_10407 [Thalassiosira oceanica]
MQSSSRPCKAQFGGSRADATSVQSATPPRLSRPDHKSRALGDEQIGVASSPGVPGRISFTLQWQRSRAGGPGWREGGGRSADASMIPIKSRGVVEFDVLPTLLLGAPGALPARICAHALQRILIDIRWRPHLFDSSPPTRIYARALQRISPPTIAHSASPTRVHFAAFPLPRLPKPGAVLASRPSPTCDQFDRRVEAGATTTSNRRRDSPPSMMRALAIIVNRRAGKTEPTSPCRTGRRGEHSCNSGKEDDIVHSRFPRPSTLKADPRHLAPLADTCHGPWMSYLDASPLMTQQRRAVNLPLGQVLPHPVCWSAPIVSNDDPRAVIPGSDYVFVYAWQCRCIGASQGHGQGQAASTSSPLTEQPVSVSSTATSGCISDNIMSRHEQDGEEARQIAQYLPYFPFKGVFSIPRFYDIGGFLAEPEVFQRIVDIFVARYAEIGIDSVAGLDARGFILDRPGPEEAVHHDAKGGKDAKHDQLLRVQHRVREEGGADGPEGQDQEGRPGPRHRRPRRHRRHAQLGDQPSPRPRGHRRRVRVRRRAEDVHRPDGGERAAEPDEAVQGAGDRGRAGVGSHQRGRADERGGASEGIRRRRRGALNGEIGTARWIKSGRVCRGRCAGKVWTPVPPPESDPYVVPPRQVRDAPQVARQVAPEDALAGRLGTSLPYLLVPRAVHELVLGQEEVALVLVGLFSSVGDVAVEGRERVRPTRSRQQTIVSISDTTANSKKEKRTFPAFGRANLVPLVLCW